MRIELDRISPRQRLTIAKGLCDYQYIMDHWAENDADFQAVYYGFYLKARWAVMSKANNAIPYFAKLQTIAPEDSLMSIIDSLRKEMESECYELSLGSKLLHTRNPSSPIYDKKVKVYLSCEENVEFWWHKTAEMRAAAVPRGTTEREKVEHDWLELCNWYDQFLASQRGMKWIKWFDDSFPNYKHISDVKKVDFIIFATN